MNYKAAPLLTPLNSAVVGLTDCDKNNHPRVSVHQETIRYRRFMRVMQRSPTSGAFSGASSLSPQPALAAAAESGLGVGDMVSAPVQSFDLPGGAHIGGERTVGPRRTTVGTISYLLLKGWTDGPGRDPLSDSRISFGNG
ncbi:hypothetical protein J6590_016451 [Homalodisca vitripennis]|nr:hypothetical protein J6590_016451 [Homalodisca vitripennis]